MAISRIFSIFFYRKWPKFLTTSIIKTPKNQKDSLKKSIVISISESELLAMVQAVSEDKEMNSIEFNEFLVMMSKYQHKELSMEEMMEAVR